MAEQAPLRRGNSGTIARAVVVGILLQVAQGAQAEFVGAHPCGELAGTKAQTGAPQCQPCRGRGVYGAQRATKRVVGRDARESWRGPILLRYRRKNRFY